MKSWPKNGSVVPFSELVESVKKALLFGYCMRRKNQDKDIPYTGYCIGKDLLATCLTPEERLKVESLKYDLEDQGRDLIDVLLGLAIQLGIEQGKRIMEKDQATTKLLLVSYIKTNRDNLDNAVSAIEGLKHK